MNSKIGGFDLENEMGDGIQISPNAAGLYIAVHSDWSGDSETGFGALCSYSITRTEAEKLSLWLQTYLAHSPTP